MGHEQHWARSASISLSAEGCPHHRGPRVTPSPHIPPDTHSSCLQTTNSQAPSKPAHPWTSSPPRSQEYDHQGPHRMVPLQPLVEGEVLGGTNQRPSLGLDSRPAVHVCSLHENKGSEAETAQQGGCLSCTRSSTFTPSTERERDP